MYYNVKFVWIFPFLLIKKENLIKKYKEFYIPTIKTVRPFSKYSYLNFAQHFS